MLVLSRKVGEQIVITSGEHVITITVREIRGDKVRLGLEAPRAVPIDREEIWNLKEQQRGAAHRADTV